MSLLGDVHHPRPCPPLALLLAVELVNRALKRHRAVTSAETANETGETAETLDETATVGRLTVVSDETRPLNEPTAEQRMWAFYVAERSRGRTPSGAELDRIAGTNNYGRRLLRQWRQQGRIVDGGKLERQPRELTGVTCLSR